MAVRRALSGTKIRSLATLREALETLHMTFSVPHVLVTSVELPEEEMQQLGMSNAASNGGKLMTLVGSSLTAVDEGTVRPWCIQFPEHEGYFSGVGDLFAALVLGRYERPEEAQLVSDSALPSPSPGGSGRGTPGAGERAETPLLTRSMVLDQLHASPTPLSRAVELAVASLQAVLGTTAAYMARLPDVPGAEAWAAEQAAAGARATPAPRTGHQHGAPGWPGQRDVELFRRRELKVVQSRAGIETPAVLHRARWLRSVEAGGGGGLVGSETWTHT